MTDKKKIQRAKETVERISKIKGVNISGREEELTGLVLEQFLAFARFAKEMRGIMVEQAICVFDLDTNTMDKVLQGYLQQSDRDDPLGQAADEIVDRLSSISDVSRK